MARYPSEIYQPRARQNRSGVVYDPNKRTVIFVEDFKNSDDEIIAIQKEVGLSPKSSSLSIAERLRGLRSLANCSLDVLVVSGDNVGIRTFNPTVSLDVNGRVRATEFQLGNVSIAGHVLTCDAFGVGTWQPGGGAGVSWPLLAAISGTAAAPAYSWFNNPSMGIRRASVNNLRFVTNGEDRLTIDSVGRVGIVTVTPEFSLDVGGSVRVGRLGVSGDLMLDFHTANTWSSGLSVRKRGTTGNIDAAVTSGSEVGYHNFFAWDGSAFKRLALAFVSAEGAITPTGGGGRYQIWTRDAITNVEAPRFTVTATGNVGINTVMPTERLHVVGNVLANAYLQISDKKVKKEIKPFKNGLSKILQLEGVSYTLKGDKKRSIGLIAQEVEKVLPEIVKTDKGTGLKSLEYAKIVVPLIEAIKDLEKRIK